MTVSEPNSAPHLRVIDGGRVSVRPQTTRAVPDTAPQSIRQSSAELAADMAELFAFALVRDVPFAHLCDPHATVRVDTRTRFTLHEILCELRSLSWFDCRAVPFSGALASAASSPAGAGDQGHRRSMRWNGDGQLTLRTLFRSGIAAGTDAALLSPHLAGGVPVRAAGDAESGPPAASAPMSRWIDWLDRAMGIAPPLPVVQSKPTAQLTTLRDLALYVEDGALGQAFFSAALTLLADGTRFDPGLSAIRPARFARPAWSGPRLLSLMATGVTEALRVSRRASGMADTLNKPGVMAARLTVMLAHPDLTSGPDGTVLRAAADEIAHAAPNLVHWMSRLNAVLGRARRHPQSVLLPAPTGVGAPVGADQAAAQVFAAGALATLIKAVFDDAPELAAGIDRLAANIALGRAAAGQACYAETCRDLRHGQAIALHLLRAALVADNRSASLSFRDFDGRRVEIRAHARDGDSGHASLRIDRDHAPWPLDDSRAVAHLTAVV